MPPVKDKSMNARETREAQAAQQQMEIQRTPMPRDGQVLGICDQRLGGSHLRVRCLDGKTRICRIPGRLKRTLWVRENDILLIEPWELGGDAKGDVVFKYRTLQAEVLRRRGLLKALESVSEF